jgi:hypothetical protein
MSPAQREVETERSRIANLLDLTPRAARIGWALWDVFCALIPITIFAVAFWSLVR